jgi:hypothetical protein
MNARTARRVRRAARPVTYLGCNADYCAEDYPHHAGRRRICSTRPPYVRAAGRRDVVSAWAGLRPLLHQEGKKPSELSRKDEIMTGTTGLLSIAGGKLTTFRRMQVS